jgi:hypothetical protein
MANREEWGLHPVPLLECTFKRAAFVGRDMMNFRISPPQSRIAGTWQLK